MSRCPWAPAFSFAVQGGGSRKCGPLDQPSLRCGKRDGVLAKAPTLTRWGGPRCTSSRWLIERSAQTSCRGGLDVARWRANDEAQRLSAAAGGTGGLERERIAMFWRTLAVLALFAAATNPLSAQTQAWPQKTVRIIVPYAAGGNSDGMSRITAQRLTE